MVAAPPATARADLRHRRHPGPVPGDTLVQLPELLLERARRRALDRGLQLQGSLHRPQLPQRPVALGDHDGDLRDRGDGPRHPAAGAPDKKFIGRGVVRTLIITPFLVMPAAAALIWSGPMLDPNFGLLNWLLEPFGVNHIAWLTRHAYGSVIVVMIWQWTPFMTLIVLAGLQGQAADVLEAAKVDGASAWATFRELTLPHLRPYIELGVLLGSIYLVTAFDQVRLMTNGGPGTTPPPLPPYLYQKVNYAFDIGGAAAAGVVTVVLTIIVATFALRMFASVFQFEEATGLTPCRCGP